jgi:DNA-binding XRE family transcriptional regulator
MMNESLARKLRVLRAARGITLREAEKLTGVTRETLGALEHGQRGAYTSTLEKMRSRKRSWHWRVLPREKLRPRGRRGALRRSGAHKKTSSAISSGALKAYGVGRSTCHGAWSGARRCFRSLQKTASTTRSCRSTPRFSGRFTSE